MSWVEAFDLGGVDVSNPGVRDYTRGAIIQWGVQTGLSNSAIYRELRSVDVGFSVGQAGPMVRAERDRQGTALTASQLGVDYSSGTLLAATPPDNWNGMYTHQVVLTTRTTNETGGYSLSSRSTAVKSSVPLTPYQAINAAMDYWTPVPGEPQTPNAPDLSQALVTQLRGVWYDTDKPGRAGVAAGAL